MEPLRKCGGKIAWQAIAGQFRRWTGFNHAHSSELDSPTLRLAPGVRACPDSTGIAMLDTETGRLFKANRIGARIWQGLAVHEPVECIAAELSRQYGAPATDLAGDVLAFVRQLRELGLVTSQAGC